MEKNTAYSAMIEELRTWAEGVSAEIRKISTQRSTDKKAQRIIELAQSESVPSIASTTVVIPEVALSNQSESEQVNHTDLVAALDVLIGKQQSNTKYKALNLQSNITMEQKKTLERVFDILCGGDIQDANLIITNIIREFAPRYVAIARGAE